MYILVSQIKRFGEMMTQKVHSVGWLNSGNKLMSQEKHMWGEKETAILTHSSTIYSVVPKENMWRLLPCHPC